MAIDDPSTYGIDILVEDGSTWDYQNNLPGYIDYCTFSESLSVCIRGFSKPELGAANEPTLRLAVDYINFAGDDLIIMLSDTDFSSGAATAKVTATGSLEGGESIFYDFAGASGNEPFRV